MTVAGDADVWTWASRHRRNKPSARLPRHISKIPLQKAGRAETGIPVVDQGHNLLLAPAGRLDPNPIKLPATPATSIRSRNRPVDRLPSAEFHRRVFVAGLGLKVESVSMLSLAVDGIDPGGGAY